MQAFNSSSLLQPSSTVVALSGKTGIAAFSATHEQVQSRLTNIIIALANAGEYVGVLIADNQFDLDAVARGVVYPQHLRITRVETPLQIRHRVQYYLANRQRYSIICIIGLLKTFYDEQVQEKEATALLTETLRMLDELARTLRILVMITPAPKLTRPQLRAMVESSVDRFEEHLALTAPPDTAIQPRLF